MQNMHDFNCIICILTCILCIFSCKLCLFLAYFAYFLAYSAFFFHILHTAAYCFSPGAAPLRLIRSTRSWSEFIWSHHTHEASPGRLRGACTPADAYGTGGRARHRRTRTAPVDTHGIGGRARHEHQRRTAPEEAHGAMGRGKERERESDPGGGTLRHSYTN